MKKLLILIILAIGLVIESVGAQDDNGNLIYPTNFNVNNDQLVNGRIKFDSAFGANSVGISGTCGMIVSGVYKNYVTKIIAQVVFIDKDGVVKHSAPSMEFYKSNFMVNGVMTQISIAKPFEFNVGRGSMSGGHLELRYKYEFDAAANIPNLTQSGWAPAVTHNKEWFIHNKKYETIDLARTVFTGSNSICNEETYTLVSPGAITLENAANVATLTRIDNNTYKITRIGSANGIVTLKSLLNGNAYTKDIAVGAVNNSVLSGSTNLFKGNIYTYSITNYNPNNTYEVILNGAGSYKRFLTLKKTDNQTYTIDATNFPDMGLSIPFQLQIRYSSACGVSSYNSTNIYIRPGNGPEW